ncbi:hypothetical protein M2281_002192 [Mesorhizobium soli]|uniref:DUF995 domain-containing protein n=1 Tax=Pseudaminobacter soli (ex Li et al. 2025) TaxID=1295366 RepID=UPI002476512F|nr:DUF995 domain-containing protein [Mesorhizobium soli]MDH6231594.1 hypothetical protein [Mesorhizobium soli]
MMSTFRIFTLTAVIAAGMAGGLAQAASQIEIDKAAALARPMSRAALEDLHKGRTWIWRDGGGFFSPDKHFLAWTRKGAQSSYAQGDWFASNEGKLCFRALWRSKAGTSPAFSCFLFRENAGVIFQKKSLGGTWYVFRHSEVQPGDEFLKLRSGDYVTLNLEKIKQKY